MKATGEVMSICTSFEGGMMKAIRSLEQHVDSLMSYDFTGLDNDQLLEQLTKIDDQKNLGDRRSTPQRYFLRNHLRYHENRYLVH